MNLPEAFQKLLKRNSKPKKEIFLSLVLDVDWVQVGAWQVLPPKVPKVFASISRPVTKDTWEDRTAVVDSLLVSLEDSAGTSDLHKVVLGLPSSFLSETGDISKLIKPHIRELTKVLELMPLGFVSLNQAVIHTLKQEEGVPPNTILLYVGASELTVSLYKIGKLFGQKTVEVHGDIVHAVEKVLVGFPDIEVLPSRMLLYGGDIARLEETKKELLKVAWQTKANFLHFPKIEILEHETIINAVSLAGASELAITIGEEEEEALVLPQKEPVLAEQEEIKEESNIVMVNPETLGFRQEKDALERESSEQNTEPGTRRLKLVHEEDAREAEDVEEERPKQKSSSALPRVHMPLISFAVLRRLLLPVQSVSSFSRIIMILIAVGLVAGVFGFLYWILPRVIMTIYTIPKTITESQKITIDPTATVVDSANNSVPGKTLEQSVSGEKILPVTGKKKVGDPAKGAVTIYNKSLTAKMFRKGTVLTSGSLSFTLDDDVSVASASASVSLLQETRTFGIAKAGITASAIGPQSNMPAGTEFTFRDVSSSTAVARSDAALTGGTSKDITVVSRADYDAVVKALTTELVEKAKQQLVTSSTSSKDKLIDATIKTSVKEKSFLEELDQEATQVHGKVTLAVSGITYNDDDVVTLLKTKMEGKIPNGYAISEGKTNVKVTDVTVKKDGKIAATAGMESIALPKLDTRAIQKEVTGKTLTQVQEYLKKIDGIAGVAFRFGFNPWKDRLPVNTQNISITVTTQE